MQGTNAMKITAATTALVRQLRIQNWLIGSFGIITTAAVLATAIAK